MGLARVGHNLATEQQQQISIVWSHQVLVLYYSIPGKLAQKPQDNCIIPVLAKVIVKMLWEIKLDLETDTQQLGS